MKLIKSTHLLALGIAAAMLIPELALAETTDFGAADLNVQANKIKDFLFGPTLRYSAIMGAGYGGIKSVATGDYRPFIGFGAVALGIGLVPKFIDGLFVAGMLLP